MQFFSVEQDGKSGAEVAECRRACYPFCLLFLFSSSEKKANEKETQQRARGGVDNLCVAPPNVLI